jgi:Baseplate J-like protein
MPTQPPLLDTRTLAQIVQQLLGEADAAFTAAPTIPRWRLAQQLGDEQVRDLLARPFDDPGLMLALAYARLFELAIQRLNQVPEKNLLAFLDVMGVSLLPPAPARVPLTFALTPGTAATRVPRGTQAATQASGGLPAVVFETEDDLTVVPATLAAGLTVDPTWDRYTDYAGQVSGFSPFGFTPLVGTQPLPHRLYLGESALLDFARQATVTLDLSWSSSQPLAAVQPFFQRLVFRRRAAGLLETVTPTAITVTAGQAVVRLPIPGPIDVETVQGVGLEQGLESRWLRAELSGPLPDDPVASSLRLDGLSLRAGVSGLLPDLAFANTAPLDLSTDFLPFGESPKVGDAFYLASTEAFGKPGANVTLHVGRTPLPPPTLVWEYSTVTGEQKLLWRPLSVFAAKDDDELSAIFEKLKGAFFDTPQPVPFLVDTTAGLTREGRLMGYAAQMIPMPYRGITASWVRARIVSGAYAEPPVLAAFIIQSAAPRDGQTVDRPPEIVYANEKQVDPDRPFQPFGPTPNRADIFAFGEATRPFPVEFNKDRPGSVLTFQVKLDSDPANLAGAVDLRWEFLGPDGWTEPPGGVSDSTLDLRRPGTVKLTVADAVESEVNGQAGYWIRARINSGGYGNAVDFELVDPDDPTQGFKIRAGTGDVQPPRLRLLTLDYDAERAPTVLTENGFLYDQPEGSFAPFVSVRDLEPAIQADLDPAFYLGFDAAFPEQPISLYAAAAPRAFSGSVVRTLGAASLPSSAPSPLRWEYFNGTDWTELIVFDGTSGLTESGSLEFLTPPDIASLAKLDLTPRYWVRARSATNDPFDTQRLQGVFLNAAVAIQAVSVQAETVGSSNGRPGQQLRFARPPVLTGQQLLIREPEPPPEQERATILLEEGADAVQERPNPLSGQPEIWVRWHEVATFLRSDLRGRHYLLDHASGLLTFGDGVRGMIPPPGTNNIIATYQSGGGSAGNVLIGAVAKIQSPLPGVASVTNPVAADGGAEVETVDQVKERGPQTLRHRQRAVSASDFEWLARQAAGTRVARVNVLPNVNRVLRFEPGWVTLVIIPGGTEARLTPSSELIREVQGSLETTAFAGLAAGVPTRVNVIGPGYLQVTVAADVVPVDIDEAEAVKQRAIGALDAFFHPLTGGPRGTGWEFARDVYESEISQVLEGVLGVSHVTRLDLLANQAQHRLVVSRPPAIDRPILEDSLVMRSDRRKVAILAEPLAPGVQVPYLAIKGFREGDRLTRTLDLSVADPVGATTVTIDGVAHPAFAIVPVAADAVGFPRGSRLASFDGARQTRLARAVPRSQAGLSQIVVEDQDFVERLQAGERLTVFYPFPLSVTSLTLDPSTGVQSLGVQPYEAAITFPTGSVMASLDNRVRLPLASAVAAGAPATVVQVDGFADGESITLGDDETDVLDIQRVDPLTDVVYLGESSLVYPGLHRITLRAE